MPRTERLASGEAVPRRAAKRVRDSDIADLAQQLGRVVFVQNSEVPAKRHRGAPQGGPQRDSPPCLARGAPSPPAAPKARRSHLGSGSSSPESPRRARASQISGCKRLASDVADDLVEHFAKAVRYDKSRGASPADGPRGSPEPPPDAPRRKSEPAGGSEPARSGSPGTDGEGPTVVLGADQARSLIANNRRVQQWLTSDSATHVLRELAHGLKHGGGVECSGRWPALLEAWRPPLVKLTPMIEAGPKQRLPPLAIPGLCTLRLDREAVRAVLQAAGVLQLGPEDACRVPVPPSVLHDSQCSDPEQSECAMVL
eukprot:TRINITY_DN22548_c0_g1_i1.p1 TRINITY_DN22548_c0_g1~~TRINITY_DN22548_c0_g1_i1.p1  ORF type:complete len:366 (+),score=53.88 TRINITY_DN22548_c0_g1_i1:160-1098(+)